MSQWGALELAERIVEGNRNEVWRGVLEGSDVAVRQSRRTAGSLEWELDLIGYLDGGGFRVPAVIPAIDGRRHINGIVVQRWLHGRAPSSAQDWMRVADTLNALHQATAGYPQRPGCSAVAELTRSSASVDADMGQLPAAVAQEVLSVFSIVATLPLAVVHGDPMASNIRIDDDGRVGLLDFDESRVDVAWHDLSNLGIQVLDDETHAQAAQLSDAWETANGWVLERDYALTRLASLRSSLNPG